VREWDRFATVGGKCGWVGRFRRNAVLVVGEKTCFRIFAPLKRVFRFLLNYAPAFGLI